jgi:hypothetical protein
MEGEFKMLNKDIMKMINNSYPNNEVKKQWYNGYCRLQRGGTYICLEKG